MTRAGEIRTRYRQGVIELFAPALAARLGQSVEEILEDGLDLGAFQRQQQVRITMADGSTMHLRHAFFVENHDDNLVGVFSEHGGYHFLLMDELHVELLEDGLVVATHRS